MKEPISILHLLGTAHREGSGVARIVAELARGLGPKYKLHAWFLQSDGPLVDELRGCGAEARWIDWAQGARDPLGAMRFWRQLRSKKFPLVHQHWGARSIRQLVRTGTDAKIIAHVHGRIVETVKGSRDPAGVRGADAIIAVSKFVAGQLPGKQVHVVYSGLAASRRTGREAPDRGDAIVIGTACRLVENKGVRELISAFAGLRKEFAFVRLEVAGSGPEQRNLIAAARELGVSEAIRFRGWVEDLRPVLRNWDVFALPSHDEALPMAILEAMAEGLPVVATNVGGIPELVEDGRTGYLGGPRDIDALRNGLRRLVMDAQLRAQMGERARERAEAKFSVQRMVAEVEAIYDCLLSTR